MRRSRLSTVKSLFLMRFYHSWEELCSSILQDLVDLLLALQHLHVIASLRPVSSPTLTLTTSQRTRFRTSCGSSGLLHLLRLPQSPGLAGSSLSANNCSPAGD